MTENFSNSRNYSFRPNFYLKAHWWKNTQSSQSHAVLHLTAADLTFVFDCLTDNSSTEERVVMADYFLKKRKNIKD